MLCQRKGVASGLNDSRDLMASLRHPDGEAPEVTTAIDR